MFAVKRGPTPGLIDTAIEPPHIGAPPPGAQALAALDRRIAARYAHATISRRDSPILRHSVTAGSRAGRIRYSPAA